MFPVETCLTVVKMQENRYIISKQEAMKCISEENVLNCLWIIRICKYFISSKFIEEVVRLLLLYCGQFILFCLYGTEKLLPSHNFWFSSFNAAPCCWSCCCVIVLPCIIIMYSANHVHIRSLILFLLHRQLWWEEGM